MAILKRRTVLMDFVYLLGASVFPEYVYKWLRPVLMLLMLLVGIATIVVIMMQKPQSDNNIGVLGGQEMDSYSRQNKARSKESILKKLTITGAVLMAVLAIFFFITFLQA